MGELVMFAEAVAQRHSAPCQSVGEGEGDSLFWQEQVDPQWLPAKKSVTVGDLVASSADAPGRSHPLAELTGSDDERRRLEQVVQSKNETIRALRQQLLARSRELRATRRQLRRVSAPDAVLVADGPGALSPAWPWRWLT
ncbi:MAG: hypothetical protein HY329_04815 [Chloroflexi bacterium]|nr:hypothetical protein [Chloroflexota bacterium]